MITRTQVRLELDITSTNYDDLITFLISAVESVWDQMTNKVWSSATYTEVFDGTGCNVIFVKNTPITGVSYVSTGESNVLSIKNTTTTGMASVSVSSSEVTCVLDSSSSTLSLTTYSTVSLLAAAINALGNGWEAEVYSNQGSMLSYALINFMGRSCTNETIDLSVPYEYLQDVEIYEDTGKIKSFGFVSGTKNIRVKYTAGYSETSCPKWLQQTLIRQVSHWYLQATEKRWHVSSIVVGEGGTINYNQGGKNNELNLLPDFVNMASMHRRINV